MLAKSQKGLES